MCTPKQKQDPVPAVLGSGGANRAALAIKDRKKQLDEELAKQGG